MTDPRICAFCESEIRRFNQPCAPFDDETIVCWSGDSPYTELLPEMWDIGAGVTVTWIPTREGARSQFATGRITELDTEPPGLTIAEDHDVSPRDDDAPDREIYVDIEGLTAHSITPSRRQTLGTVRRIDYKALPDAEYARIGPVHARYHGDMQFDGPFVWAPRKYYTGDPA